MSIQCTGPMCFSVFTHAACTKRGQDLEVSKFSAGFHNYGLPEQCLESWVQSIEGVGQQAMKSQGPYLDSSVKWAQLSCRLPHRFFSA